jgi:F-type H+-transporting ATPase subunit a
MVFKSNRKIIVCVIAMMLSLVCPSIAQSHDDTHTDSSHNTEAQMPDQNGAQSVTEEEGGLPTEASGHGAHGEEAKKPFNVNEVLFGHVMDSHDWHIFSIGKGHDAKHFSIPLPVILFSKSRGLSIFSSARFHHGHETYDGYQMPAIDGGANMKEKITFIENPTEKIYDFSITKNVFCMFLSIAILLLIMFAVAKRSKRNGVNKAPTGIQNAVEPLVTFIRDDVAKAYLGNKYAKYMPLLLTFFFFIWINNLLGLLPLGFNFTGNIAVTVCLALVFFVVMMFNSNKYFWGHIFNPPGVPLGIKFILVPIEFVSIFIKPVALALRLFANIFAGHTIIICVISLIFIFAEKFGSGLGWGTSIISIAFTVFMFFLELLVAAIQAFIFTNLAAIFIGSAIEEHHHDDAHAH